jgi:hypothetical protein
VEIVTIVPPSAIRRIDESMPMADWNISPETLVVLVVAEGEHQVRLGLRIGSLVAWSSVLVNLGCWADVAAGHDDDGAGLQAGMGGPASAAPTQPARHPHPAQLDT